MTRISFTFIVFIIIFQIYPLFSQKPDNPQIFQKEINAFSKTDSVSMPKPGVILFTGSSSIRGWRTLQEDFPGLPVLNRGFGGSRIGDAIYYFDQLITKYKPQKIVFYSGENDIASGKDAEKVLKLFIQFSELVKEKLPDTELIYLSMKPSIARWEMYDEMAEANLLIRSYISSMDWIKYVDVASPMLDKDGNPKPEIFLGDKLHMNKQGYYIWTNKVRPYIQ